MIKHSYLARGAVLLLLALVASIANAQSSDLLYNCGFSGSGGDRTTRGFYVDNYPGTTLGTVVIILGAVGSDGLHSITMNARENTYDGNLIGSVSLDVNLVGRSNEVLFEFGDAAVTPGVTVTFQMVVTSSPFSVGFAYYDVGDGTACDDVTQTNGTNPPLDSFRRNTVGLRLFGTSSVTPPPDNEAPIASFTFVCSDLDCAFDGSGSSDSDGDIANWDWDFGDSTVGSGENTMHSFAASGEYNVVLTVTDDEGATGKVEKTVTVDSVPIAPPSVEPVVPVPAISAWGKLGMVFVLMLAGMGYVRRFSR